VRVVA